MKLVIFVVVLLIFTFSEAFLNKAPPSPFRRYRQCYNPNTGHMIHGQLVRVFRECKVARCEYDGSTTYYGCEFEIFPEEQCEMLNARNFNAPYPDCCPILSCTLI